MQRVLSVHFSFKFFMCVVAFVLISVLHGCGHFDKNLKYNVNLSLTVLPLLPLHKDLKANKHLHIYLQECKIRVISKTRSCDLYITG